MNGSGASADRYEWPTVGITAAFLVLLLASASRARKIIANWASGAVRPEGPASAGRRTFLRLAVSGMAVDAMAGVAAVRATPAAAAPDASACQNRYSMCYGYDPFENQCCIDCLLCGRPR